MASALATFGSGCFWCSEALFQQLKGVISARPGYSGGSVPHPSYEQVCTGRTGHAEVLQLEFDPAVIPYRQLVELFFATHNPTTLNRQGHDVGTQYRSVIFYHDEEQRQVAETVRHELESQHAFDDPIVTSIEPFRVFYPAEPEHVNYYAKHPDAAYCQAVINPKMAKFRVSFASLLKS